ncbi:hypothetical protein MRX96_056105 [Rhipicephalus microplus]
MSGGVPYGGDVPSATPAPTEHRQWASELQVTLSSASIAFGLVSAWRLPALLYENGGGSFLLAYSVLLPVLGYPLLYMELVLGHYARLGPGALTRCLPIAKGVERLCTEGEVAKGCVNVTESVNEHFFHTSLGTVSGNDEAGVRPELLGCLAAAWIIVTVTIILALTIGYSLLYSIIVFSSLGSLAWEIDTPVERALHSGQGAMFVALNSYSVHWAYSGLFFFFVLVLGAQSQATLLESALTHWVDTFPNMVPQKPALAMAHCAVGFMAGLPLVSRQAGLQLLHLVNAQVLGPLLMYTAFCQVAAVSWFYGFEHFRLDVLLMYGEPWNSTLEALWTWVLPPLLSCAFIGSLASGACSGVEPSPGLPEACIAAWVLIAVGVAQVPLWAAKAAASLNRSMTSRCLVPSSLMELHQLSASDGGPAVETLHP